MAAETRKFVIWGSAGHALVLAESIVRDGGEVLALIDNDPQAASPLPGVVVHIGRAGFEQWQQTSALAGAALGELRGLVAIGGGRGRDRLEIQHYLAGRGIRIATLVHPDATVHAGVALGAGSQVLAQAVVAAGTSIGRGCIINHRAGVDHECRLGDGVHVAPGATLCGCITLEDNVFVGAGAVILPRIHVGADAVIGAGAVVTRNVPPGTTVVGNPARPV